MGKFYPGIADSVILYVRQLGWLHAHPEQTEVEKKAKLLSKSRLEQIYGDSPPALPACDAIYIVNYLFDMGPVISNGMGGAPLSYLDIDAFQRCTGIELNAFESQLIRRASVEYLQALESGKNRDAPEPFRKTLTVMEKLKVAQKVKAIFRE